MLEAIKGFVEFRYDHLTRKNIVRTYIAVLILNLLAFSYISVKSQGKIEVAIIFAMLILYITICNMFIFSVKKLMLRTYLFKGTTGVYSSILIATLCYYLINEKKGHDLVLIILFTGVLLLSNLSNYILAMRDIKSGKFLKKSSNNVWTTGKVMALVGGIFSVRILYTFIIINGLDIKYPVANRILLLIAYLALVYIFSINNIMLLKAYYIKKYNMEKDECKYVNICERLQEEGD